MRSRNRGFQARTPKVDAIDLNTIEPKNDGNFNPSLGISTATNESGTITAHLRDIEEHLINYISQAECIIGCVAWLTNRRILQALSKLNNVALVVQKEDFLRPDLNSGEKWREHLRQMYASLNCHLTREDFPGLMKNLSVLSDPTLQAVRCVGNFNRDKHPAFPRMHHKFILFCRVTEGQYTSTTYDNEGSEIEAEYPYQLPRPYAVWTGSFNFTENAIKSLENGLYISEPSIVQAYYDEWARIEAISEPLDWENDWVAPEWRIGT